MLPGGILSTTPITGAFQWSRNEDIQDDLISYEMGGIALNDASMGLHYQMWKGSLVENNIMLESATQVPVSIYTGVNITGLSISFDQNMRPTAAFTENGLAKLLWYDSTVPGQVVTTLAAGVTTPKVTMDDKRSTQSGISDIILSYVRDFKICYRQQRDRFETEYILTDQVCKRLIKVGMNSKLRLQWMFEEI